MRGRRLWPMFMWQARLESNLGLYCKISNDVISNIHSRTSTIESNRTGKARIVVVVVVAVYSSCYCCYCSVLLSSSFFASQFLNTNLSLQSTFFLLLSSFLFVSSTNVRCVRPSHRSLLWDEYEEQHTLLTITGDGNKQDGGQHTCGQIRHTSPRQFSTTWSNGKATRVDRIRGEEARHRTARRPETEEYIHR